MKKEKDTRHMNLKNMEEGSWSRTKCKIKSIQYNNNKIEYKYGKVNKNYIFVFLAEKLFVGRRMEVKNNSATIGNLGWIKHHYSLAA